MAELPEKYEVIMEIGFACTDGTEFIVANAKKVGDIVRCKDCLHKHKNWISFDTNDNPLHHCEVMNQMVRDDFFCAEGIRENDG